MGWECRMIDCGWVVSLKEVLFMSECVCVDDGVTYGERKCHKGTGSERIKNRIPVVYSKASSDRKQ